MSESNGHESQQPVTTSVRYSVEHLDRHRAGAGHVINDITSLPVIIVKFEQKNRTNYKNRNDET